MNRNGTHAPIVVGVDDSSTARKALEWASAEAEDMDRPLHIVHGFLWPLMSIPSGPMYGGPPRAGLQAAAEQVLADAEERARTIAPGVKITTELVVAGAEAALLSQAHDAELLVVGSRGLGEFGSVLLGSVGVALASHAPCPVVVVRSRPRDRVVSSLTTGRIVVGVDGSDSSSDAFRFAVQTAARRHAIVTAVVAQTDSNPTTARRTGSDANYGVGDNGSQLLDEARYHTRHDFSEVVIDVKMVRGHPGEALIRESTDADLMVVGSRGLGGFRGLLLGSVSQALLLHAECPVAVVRRRC